MHHSINICHILTLVKADVIQKSSRPNDRTRLAKTGIFSRPLLATLDVNTVVNISEKWNKQSF